MGSLWRVWIILADRMGQVSEALRIKESKDKETQQRTTIANQYVAEQTQTQTRIQNLKPKSEPESEPKPELEQEPETESEPESDSESETEPKPEPEPRTQSNQNLQHNKRGKKKTKPEPPPEEYIISRLTHINLNDKLEYNRSTIPFPDDRPPTEEETKAENNVKTKINQLRAEYLRQKTNPKPKPKPKPTPKTKR